MRGRGSELEKLHSKRYWCNELLSRGGYLEELSSWRERGGSSSRQKVRPRLLFFLFPFLNFFFFFLKKFLRTTFYDQLPVTPLSF